MNRPPVPEGDEPAKAPRRGRRPSEVDPRVVGTHLVLLSVLRDRHQRDGRTVEQLGRDCNFVKSKISELLRGYGGKYPRWEITKAVAAAMDLPLAPLCRLWLAGAREARKKEKWIEGNAGVEDDLRAPMPRALEGLRELHGATYRAYAGVFLRPDAADGVVEQALTVVWARMDVAFSSASVAGHVWTVLRELVMAWADPSTAHGVAASRTVSVRWGRDLPDLPDLPDLQGLPDLADLASTSRLPRLPGLGDDLPDPRDPFGRLTEQTDLFRAMRELAPRHADVLILRYVLRRSAEETADVLGTDPGMVGLWDRQAQEHLEQAPHFRTTTGGMTT
ncbi:sigma-70 family RNA polymerase sigma factor [Streptomyces chilikensis]|uniref:sigma-70 family RNA polymerase sigma factor n=1 Tax=Streptomyces chilikensis TaxID=1194079 RepID=UPI000AF96533|nr:sigma-70 family RNA polymerase sigma factor [Streptomyces chilikensis]